MYNRSMDEVEELVRAGAFDRAATLALETYGSELYGFLINVLGKEPDAAEVFLQLGEDLWRGLPAFGFHASIRTWLYVLARNAAARYVRSPWQQRGRRASDAQLEDVIARSRSGTAPWLRTEVKDRVRALREALDPDDRTLLILRVDRQLAWADVARVTLGTDAPSDAALARETMRVTKRFQLIKDRLKRLAREAGMLEDEA